MNVSAIKAYNQPINQGYQITDSAALDKLKTDSDKSKLDLSAGNNTNKSIITKKERDFFMKLFPENSAQIEKHELFKR